MGAQKVDQHSFTISHPSVMTARKNAEESFAFLVEREVWEQPALYCLL